MKTINKEKLHNIFVEIANKNEAKFKQLYEQYYQLVYQIAFSIVKNKEDSEEIVQIVFLKIWKMKKEQLPTQNEASWLYKTTKNETLNYIRAKKTEISLDELYDISEENKEIDTIIEKDKYNRIIAKLKPEEQEIVSLKILSGLSFKQIAEVLQIPMGTVQWKYYKSLYTLRILLGNLSMLVMTVSLLITKKLLNQKENNAQNMAELKTESAENIKEQGSHEATKTEIATDTVIENEITQNVIAEGKTVLKLSYSDIGVLSLSGIFLMITIIFFIFFMKYQQNARKKVSK